MARQLLFRDFGKGAPALFKKATTRVEESDARQAFVRIGPNPATDVVVVQVNVDAQTDATLVLSDIRGMECRSARVEPWTGVGRLELTGLPAGTYIVTLHAGRSIAHTTIQITR